MENLKGKKQLLKSMLSVYKQMDIEAYSITNYKNSKNFFNTIHSMRDTLVQFNVLIEEIDSDGITYNVNPEFE